jgi:serine/threonine protein kinase
MADRVGQKLGNYRLVRLIGKGGFAEVYLAEHQYLRTQAAIKLLHTQLTDDDLTYFQAEARTVAHLVHPHIVRVLEFGVEDTTPFLVMDYAPHGTLRQLHPKGSRVPLSTVISHIRQLADALDYAHSQGVIHRDIKPENMLLSSSDTILLGDFGIAQVAQSSRYQNMRDMAGTISYMAPEQVKAHPVPASDQYSLAVVVYEWLTGDRPFNGSFTEIAVKHALVPPPSFGEKGIVGISPAVEQVVMTALAKEPEQRFAQVRAFANALEQANQTAIARQNTPLPPTFSTSEADTYLSLPNQPAASEAVLGQIDEAIEARTVLSRPGDRVTPIPATHELLRSVSSPGLPHDSTEPFTPQRQLLNETPVRVAPSDSTSTSARKGFFGARSLLLVALLLVLMVVSTGIYLTVFAHKGAATTNSPKPGTTTIASGPTSTTTPSTVAPVAAQDTFQRPDQLSWGVASDGQHWSNDALNSAIFSIVNHAGQVAQGKGTFNALLGPKRSDSDVLFVGSVSHFGSGANIGSVVRWTDDGNWYKVLIDGQHLNFLKRVNGKNTQFASMLFTAQDNVHYSIRFRAVGATLVAKVWQSDQQEPHDWMLRATDTSLSSGFDGFRFSIVPGVVETVYSFVETKAHTLT